MKYKKVVEGRFISRPNRFIAYVGIDGKVETVHVKNTGRCKELLTDESLAVLINSYTAGVSPAVMSYILNTTVSKRFGGSAQADEIGLPVTTTGLVLPCGSTAVWTK